MFEEVEGESGDFGGGEGGHGGSDEAFGGGFAGVEEEEADELVDEWFEGHVGEEVFDVFGDGGELVEEV